MVFLGTGTSHGVPVIGCECATCHSDDPRDRRTRCAVVLGLPQGNLLIDSPPELRLQLVRERIGRVHAVCYTHAHADHLMGLDDLRIFSHYLGHELPIYCTAAVEARIRHAFDYAFDADAHRIPAGGLPRLAFRRIDESPFEVLGATVTPLPILHGRMRVLGYRVGDVAYCTDCNAIPAETYARMEGLSTLVIDCLRRRPHPTHFDLAGAMEAAGRVAARQTLFTHLCHEMSHAETEAQLPPGFAVAYDGLRVACAVG